MDWSLEMGMVKEGVAGAGSGCVGRVDRERTSLSNRDSIERDMVLSFDASKLMEYLWADILALCSRMRAVVMVDYGGKMPELQERLYEESSIFQHLRVMVIEDMIYLIHVQELAEFVWSSLNSETELLFVDLERDPPKMITQTEKSLVAMQLVSVQKLFSLVFPVDGMNSELLPCHRTDSTRNDKSTIDELGISECPEFIDLSSCMQETQVTVPTLNGKLEADNSTVVPPPGLPVSRSSKHNEI
ncbi:hypothetical protein TEA_001125 [Camellia sinensis var. sinensis]|uniref:Uncharacterized protein n=1 Tax=Camellia sinensis var. sinensis TaxID=542762 RepID=A0A4S4DC63_CAMSN|nr:hypothetical protein TEA_001125 [Camellia sinensis var. sinensis]